MEGLGACLTLAFTVRLLVRGLRCGGPTVVKFALPSKSGTLRGAGLLSGRHGANEVANSDGDCAEEHEAKDGSHNSATASTFRR